MRNAILFLHGKYAAVDLNYYKRLTRGRYLVAVDGGYSFFRKTRLTPDLLIGDFDSIGRMPRTLTAKTTVVQHPAYKDKTDAELAVDHCLSLGVQEIYIVQPSFGEPDQFVGNLMLLIRAAQLRRRMQGCSVHVVNRRYRVCALADGAGMISGGRGDIFSVVPISDQIALTLSGTEYDVTNLVIQRGESRGLRNRITANPAHIRVRGTALVIRQFAGRT